MNTIERRALYNLLRMNWLSEPTLVVDTWQVEDYRLLPIAVLFNRLKEFNICLDQISFTGYAYECDSPEDLTDHLVGDRDFSLPQEDQVYLIVFELWRRLVSEKPSFSIVCNELDYQINLYDEHQLNDPLALQNALTKFAQMLDENADEGIPSKDVLNLISNYCANDIETFLYDFISEQIEVGNEAYVRELLDEFRSHFKGDKWFKLIEIRLSDPVNHKFSQRVIEEIVEENLNGEDLGFNLEFLAILSEKRFSPFFFLVLRQTLPLVKREEDFQDLLSLVIEFFYEVNLEQQGDFFQGLLEKRTKIPSEKEVSSQDPDMVELSSKSRREASYN